LTCIGTPTTITVRVPNPDEWGLRADIYTWTGSEAPWPPFQEPDYIYRGTWSVGGIYFWLYVISHHSDQLGVSSPYFSGACRGDTPPKWVAYWLDPTATTWTYWAVKFTGRLYVQWERIRVGMLVDDGVYSINTGNSWWNGAFTFNTTNGWCWGTPREYDVEVGYYNISWEAVLIFVIGPEGSNEAYVHTIDGAWFCPNFDWARGRCNVSWSFVPASPSVPHFRGTNYTPSTTDDGGGTSRP
jgi:hypothetical protein